RPLQRRVIRPGGDVETLLNVRSCADTCHSPLEPRTTGLACPGTTIMPPQVQRRNVHQKLWTAGRPENMTTQAGSRPSMRVGDMGRRPLPDQPCTLSMTVLDPRAVTVGAGLGTSWLVRLGASDAGGSRAVG